MWQWSGCAICVLASAVGLVVGRTSDEAGSKERKQYFPLFTVIICTKKGMESLYISGTFQEELTWLCTSIRNLSLPLVCGHNAASSSWLSSRVQGCVHLEQTYLAHGISPSVCLMRRMWKHESGQASTWSWRTWSLMCLRFLGNLCPTKEKHVRKLHSAPPSAPLRSKIWVRWHTRWAKDFEELHGNQTRSLTKPNGN